MSLRPNGLIDGHVLTHIGICFLHGHARVEVLLLETGIQGQALIGFLLLRLLYSYDEYEGYCG